MHHLLDQIAGQGHKMEIIRPNGYCLKGAVAGNTYIDSGNLLCLNSTSFFTIELWILTTNYTSSEYYITKAAAANDRLMISTLSNYLGVYINDKKGGVTNYQNYIGGNNVAYHLVVIYDGTQSTDATKLKMYINGIEITLAYDSPIPTYTGPMATNLFIGNTTASFSGTLYSVRIWNRPLEENKVKRLYNRGSGIKNTLNGNKTFDNRNLFLEYLLRSGTGTSIQNTAWTGALYKGQMLGHALTWTRC